MPPINWAKYQIVGEPLDKMHQEQVLRPSTGEPQPLPSQSQSQSRPAYYDSTGERAPEHVLAAPYRPLVDKLDNNNNNPVKQARGGTKKDKK
jgi:hypothetical protein